MRSRYRKGGLRRGSESPLFKRGKRGLLGPHTLLDVDPEGSKEAKDRPLV